MSNKVKVIIACLSTAVFVGTIVFSLSYLHLRNVRQDYDEQIAEYQATQDEVGELTTCYAVSKNVKTVEKGEVITAKNVEEIQMPASKVNAYTIVDIKDIENKYFKVDLHPGTPITSDMVMEEKIEDSTREEDIVMDNMPIGLKEGDYVDFRITYPKGEDYIVLSHKRVLGINGNTVKVYMDEMERMLYVSATIDKFLNAPNGSVTGITKYVEPGVQEPAEVYYNVPANILTVIMADPNIIDKVLTYGVNRDIIEREFNNFTSADGGNLASGRSDYESKLETAKNAYGQQQQDAEANMLNDETANEEEDETTKDVKDPKQKEN